MNLRHAAPVPAFLAIALLAACGSPKTDASPSASDPGTEAVAVETVSAAAGDLVDGIDVTGTLAPRFEAEIKADISGRVAVVHVTEWAKVRAGDPLATIDDEELRNTLRKAEAAVAAAEASAATTAAGGATARANEAIARAGAETARSGLAEAKVVAERAEREYQRLTGLKSAGLATAQALDEGRTVRDSAVARIATGEKQVAAAEAQVAAAAAQITVATAQAAAAEAGIAVAREDVRQVKTRLAKAVVRAPFDGTVAARLVSPGEVVGEMQKVLFRIVDNSHLTLTVFVPSGEMAKLRVGQELTFCSEACPGRTFGGRIAHINPEVDPKDRSVRVTVDVPNDRETLKGGLFVTGRIITGIRPGVVRVPRTAIVNWDIPAGSGEVYVAASGVARRRPVTIGAVSGDLAEITGGVAAGEEVVVRGGFNLKDGDRIASAAGR